MNSHPFPIVPLTVVIIFDVGATTKSIYGQHYSRGQEL